MSSCAATRRASSAASSEQQLFLNSETVSATSWSRIQTPTTSWPCSVRSAAATDESTPPDIATRTRVMSACSETPSRHPDALAEGVGGEDRGGGARSGDHPRDDLDGRVDLVVRGSSPERDAQRATRLLLRVAHGGQDVGWVGR